MDGKHKRIGVACLGCRTAKSKCDGIIPDMISDTQNDQQRFEAFPSCSRCSLHHIPCLWKPPHRPGRPKKGLEAKSHPKYMTPQIPVTSAASPSSALQETTDINDFFFFDFMSSNAERQLSPPPLSSTTTPSTSLSSMCQLQQLSDRVRPDEPLLGTVFPDYPSIELGLRRFFASFALIVPVLGLSCDYYKSIFANQVTFAACVAASLGHSMYTTSASSLVQEAIEQALSVQPIDSFDQIAGHLLLAYLYYGMNKLQSASEQLRKGTEFCLELKYHIQDEVESLSDEPRKEMERRVWWELRIADIMMNITTSGECKSILDRNFACKVNTPKDLVEVSRMSVDVYKSDDTCH